MSVTYRIDSDERIVYLTLTGDTYFYAWQEAMLAVLADPSYRPGFGFLIDRRAAPAPNTDFIKRVVSFNQSHRDELGGGLRAVVVGSTADFGMGRMAEMFSEGGPTHIRVFTDIDEALRWLRGPTG